MAESADTPVSERERLEERLYGAALRDLASVVVEPDGAEERRHDGSHDELSVAAVVAARAAGVHLTVPRRLAADLPLDARLDALCAASRARRRRVSLRGDWWRRDCGAFLAFRADGAPVALLPSKPGRYEAFDPATNALTPVDADVAESLAPDAYAFYARLPDGRVAAKHLLGLFSADLGNDLVAVVALGIASAVLGMAVPLATGTIFDVVVPSADRSALAYLTFGLVGAALANAAFAFSQAIALSRVESKWGSSLQAAVWDRLLRLPASFFRGYPVGDLAMRANTVDAMRRIAGGTALASALASLQAGFNFFLLFYYDKRLALVAAALLIVIGSYQAVCLWLSLVKRRALAELEGRLGGLVLQLLDGVSKLRVAAAEPRAFAVWGRRYAEAAQAELSAERVGVWASVFNGAAPILSTMALYYVVHGSLHPDPSAGPATPLSVGDFVAFSAAFSTFLAAGLSLSQTAMQLLDLGPLWERCRPILETLPEDDGSKPDPGELSGRIELSHATFRYREDGPRILDDINFSVAPGEFVALVGPSGSGKSTLLRLLLGFETPESGAVYYDGKDAAKHDIVAIRRQMGVVLQNARLIAGDVYANIAGGVPLSMDQAWAAAEQAGIAEEIRAMPMGMRTVVGEGASTLSGGQRQRLIVARALARRPRVILFDEATSALDNRTQTIVTDSLAKLKTTRLVIAHRLSTIRQADRILVLEGGRIVQSGSYEELVAAPGLFQELARRQTA